MGVTLFAVPSSHPSLAAELMLRHKGIGYRRIDLVSGLHRGILRALGYPGVTVPAVRLNGARVQGTRAIALALDAVTPEPPLFPADPERRAAVDAAESWGDEVLQPVPRRIIWASLKRDRSTVASYLEGTRTGLPTPVAATAAIPIIPLAARLNNATDENVRRDLAVLPDLVDHVDELLSEGTIGAEERNVADFQVATSVSLLLTMEDTRQYIEGRPAERHAREIVGRQPGRLPSALPTQWLPPVPERR
jgi:glutathione S-transferase